MPEKHLSSELFEKLMRDEMSPAEARELVWHLLETCPGCAEAVDDAAVRIDTAREVDEHVFDGSSLSFERIEQRLRTSLARIEQDQKEATEFLDGLARLPVEHQCLVIRNSTRHHTVAMCEIALERCREMGLEDPKSADLVAAVLLEIAGGLTPDTCGDPMLQDLQARAWAYRGNFRRILSDLRSADAAFRRAESHLACGTGDQLELARLLDLKSSLRSAQNRFDEAHELIRRCVALYVAAEERHLAGRAMISQSKVFADSGDNARALQSVQQALQMIDAEREPRLYLIGQFNEMIARLDLGRHQEAMAALPRVRRLSIEYGTRFDLLRLRWIEGNLLEGLGHDARAEAAYLEVRRGFIELEDAYDAALVSLELGALYTRQNRTADLKRLVAEMLPIFESRDLHQQALAALSLFRQAVERETLSVRMIEEVAGFLRAARHDPARQFDLSEP